MARAWHVRLHVGSVRHPRTGLLLRLQQRTRPRERHERRRGPGRGWGRLVRRLRLLLRLRRGRRRCPGEPFLKLWARRAGRRWRRIGARVRREVQLAVYVHDIVGGEEGGDHLLPLGLWYLVGSDERRHQPVLVAAAVREQREPRVPQLKPLPVHELRSDGAAERRWRTAGHRAYALAERRLPLGRARRRHVGRGRAAVHGPLRALTGWRLALGTPAVGAVERGVGAARRCAQHELGAVVPRVGQRQRPPALADEDQIVVVAAAAAAAAAGRCRHGHTRAAAAGGRYGSRRRDDHAAIIFVGCD
jgi:hypothetical protein